MHKQALCLQWSQPNTECLWPAGRSWRLPWGSPAPLQRRRMPTATKRTAVGNGTNNTCEIPPPGQLWVPPCSSSSSSSSPAPVCGRIPCSAPRCGPHCAGLSSPSSPCCSSRACVCARAPCPPNRALCRPSPPRYLNRGGGWTNMENIRRGRQGLEMPHIAWRRGGFKGGRQLPTRRRCRGWWAWGWRHVCVGWELRHGSWVPILSLKAGSCSKGSAEPIRVCNAGGGDGRRRGQWGALCPTGRPGTLSEEDRGKHEAAVLSSRQRNYSKA